MYLVQQIRPFTGVRYGEITAVIAVPQRTVVKGDPGHLYLYDPNQASCDLAAQHYVGLSALPIERFWQIYLKVNSWLSQPSPAQMAAGQRWLACIVSPPPVTSEAAPYSCTLRGAIQTGQERNNSAAPAA